MPLTPEQQAEIEAQRAATHTTRRVTVAALEEILYQPTRCSTTASSA